MYLRGKPWNYNRKCLSTAVVLLQHNCWPSVVFSLMIYQVKKLRCYVIPTLDLTRFVVIR